MNEPKLQIEDRGGGSPALVFLHYFAGSSRSWRHVVDRAANACRCVRLDVPGFGRSPPLPTYSVHGVAQVIGAAITRLRLESYALVGHSMGGKLAVAVALARPLGLAGLVLVAPSPPSPEPMDEGERSRLLASHAIALRRSAPFARSRAGRCKLRMSRPASKTISGPRPRLGVGGWSRVAGRTSRRRPRESHIQRSFWVGATIPSFRPA